MKTPEEIMRQVTQQAMENHHILSETKLAAAAFCLSLWEIFNDWRKKK